MTLTRRLICRLASPSPVQVYPALLATLLAIAGLSPATAQAPTPYMNRNVIVLDPAHGGQDNGVALNGQAEKDVTLTLAASLRNLLAARGFTVALTRDAELPAAAPLLTTDQRAGLANHLRPVACIVLHATGTGTGVHVATSALDAPDLETESGTAIHWESAQTAFLPQSQRLANDLGFALLRSKMPVLLTRASIRPLDNLTCPAVVIEVAPQAGSGRLDPGYLQAVAETLSAAMQKWRDLTVPQRSSSTVPPAAKPALSGTTP